MRDMGGLIFLLIILIANIHVVSGLKISYKNFYDYGLNFLAGVFLIFYILDLYNTYRLKFALKISVIILFLILASNVNVSGISFKDRSWRIYLSEQSFHSYDVAESINQPFNYYINDKNFRGKMAYSNNKAIAPIFAYQYFLVCIRENVRRYMRK
jgi:hypothetical protein